MVFSWLKKRRRRKLLAEPFPRAWLGYLEKNLPFYAALAGSEKKRLQDRMRIFAAEKSWEGCGGLEITDEIKVTVAAQACLLVLGMKENYFDHVETILIYPAEYFSDAERFYPDGTMDEDGEGRIGEAWHRGPVVLSWADVRRGGRHPHDGVNVVYHEFAHQLDMQSGWIDGTPPLKGRAAYARWHEVMSAEFEKLVRRSRRGFATLMDDYGAENPAEFFAVATEFFFEKPIAFARRHPRLYAILKEYYGQDPAMRLRVHAGEDGIDKERDYP
jgi:Mlc titration factor MtfA (ptsG expression regulator)